MTDDEIQSSAAAASHGSFFKKKRSIVPYTPVPPQAQPPHDSSDEQSSTFTRPSTALSTSSSIRESSFSSLSDHKSYFARRSASLRSPTKARLPHWDYTQAVQNVLDKRTASTNSVWSSQQTGSTFGHRSRSSEGANDICTTISNPIIHTGEGEIIHTPLSPPSSWRPENSRLPTTAPNTGSAQGIDGGDRLPANSASQNAPGTFQRIQNLASKRISTLDYLRKAHEGHTYWLTALQFQKTDLNKLPYFDPRKLGRRATNYLHLGVSLPTILDPNSDTPVEYLKTFNALLTEFESYQSIHSPEGQSSGSLGRARIPQMFKRATQGSGPKSRRTSNPMDAVSPPNSYGYHDSRSFSGGSSVFSSAAFSSFPASEQELSPGEEYTFLLTPFLPFEPDYFETFATLCDVLIDCYTKVIGLINSPEACGPGIGELFTKADAKVRKLLIASLVQDFEDATKQGIRTELAGVGKVVLGGLM